MSNIKFFQKLFHSKKNIKPATPISGDSWLDHYTTPKNAIGIIRDGGIRSYKKIGNISTYQTAKDPLKFKDLNEISDKNFERLNKPISDLPEHEKNWLDDFSDKNKIKKPNKYTDLDLKVDDNFSHGAGNRKPESQLRALKYYRNGGDPSHLFVNTNGGSIAEANNPEHMFQSIDGLHEGDGVRSVLTYKKTRNPIMFLIDGKNYPLQRGSDTGEIVVKSPNASVNNTVFINPSQYTHDTDARKLRKYLRAHKGNFGMTKELHEFLYGKQNKRNNNYPTQNEITDRAMPIPTKQMGDHKIIKRGDDLLFNNFKNINKYFSDSDIIDSSAIDKIKSIDNNAELGQKAKNVIAYYINTHKAEFKRSGDDTDAAEKLTNIICDRYKIIDKEAVKDYILKVADAIEKGGLGASIAVKQNNMEQKEFSNDAEMMYHINDGKKSTTKYPFSDDMKIQQTKKYKLKEPQVQMHEIKHFSCKEDVLKSIKAFSEKNK